MVVPSSATATAAWPSCTIGTSTSSDPSSSLRTRTVRLEANSRGKHPSHSNAATSWVVGMFDRTTSPSVACFFIKLRTRWLVNPESLAGSKIFTDASLSARGAATRSTPRKESQAHLPSPSSRSTMRVSWSPAPAPVALITFRDTKAALGSRKLVHSLKSASTYNPQ
eukprot:CAMPEP_0194748866 /NCGR_PEP_ID=MMETSP0323_2-20130528/3040_1 /TAXON_ID=2866 ORGANISM="Crypthecodinium cohnii, Strain Seligo" /NCGR_SAMPLE_ID=MMETSP0323_2 /ASSEMBLY_ACC=CAM_ASM_000346 /LENGTH=166 /DNA_ID=CAMNT_0039663495 /DNA_START=70 /DNA_END=570 /DNA_ORIENTATION=+